jgi:predicted nucleic acid-binding Zn ribbon protein
MIPTKPRMQHQLQRMPSIQCPICSQLIPVSIHQLLFARSLHCPVCGLSLFIDKKKSDKALKILAKVDEAQRRVEDTSHFSK